MPEPLHRDCFIWLILEEVENNGQKCLFLICPTSFSIFQDETHDHIVFGRSPPAPHSLGSSKVTGKVSFPEVNSLIVRHWSQVSFRAGLLAVVCRPRGPRVPRGGLWTVRKPEFRAGKEKPDGVWWRKTVQTRRGVGEQLRRKWEVIHCDRNSKEKREKCSWRELMSVP